MAEDIGERIEELRVMLGLTQGELAERAGVHPPQVSNWIQGKQRPSKRRLEAWARNEDWPVGMFADAGPRPAEAVNSPVNARKQTKVRAGSRPLYEASEAELAALPPDQVVFRLSLELADHIETGRAIPVTRGMWMLEQAFRAGARSAEANPDRRTGTGE